MTPLDRLLLVRQGGHVERSHTTPHHGSYTVASHSWGVAQIILTFHPLPTIELVRAALNHDVHERWIGDLPGQVIWENDELRDLLKELEAGVNAKLGISAPASREDVTWLYIADKIDLLLWAFDQVDLGNKSAERFVERLKIRFRDLAKHIPKPLETLLADLFERRDRGWTRDSDLP